VKSTGQKLILVSFVLALMAAVFIFVYLRSLNTPKVVAKKTTILVAVETIPPRTLIKSDMIKEIEVEESSIFSEYIKDSSKIAGKYTKETILKNEGFHNDKLISEDKQELSLKISDNYRAVTVNATGPSGVAYLIKPGDFIDIIAYLGEKRDGVKLINPDIAKIILQNVQVLAIDNRLNRDNVQNGQANEKAPATFLVTLSVPIADLEKLVLAEHVGSLKLALRPLKESDISNTDGSTWEELTVNIEAKPGSETPQAGSSENENHNETKPKYTTYIVKKGDTLRKISTQVYGDPRKYYLIKAENKIGDEDIILTGEVLKIPILE
jgi:pilus assembly protein CpaB